MIKFTAQRKELRGVVAKVQGICGRKSNIHITENVLFKVSSDGIDVSATDLETGFMGFIPADIESEGNFAINGKKLFEIVKDFPSDEIHFEEVENRWIRIENGKVEYNIVGINPEDFPNQPLIETAVEFAVNSASLKRMIERACMITGASDDRRPHINGVRVERGDALTLRLVSTDGSRLAKSDDFSEETEIPEFPSILVPKKALVEIGKWLPAESSEIGISVNERYFAAEYGKDRMVVRLLEGDFPSYGDIVNRSEGFRAEINRAVFLSALKRMSIFSTENYKGVVFEFDAGNLKLSATNPDIGESKETIDAKWENERLRISFNPKFFIDALTMMDGETVVLNLLSEERPCILKSVDDEEGRYVNVIMPMRI